MLQTLAETNGEPKAVQESLKPPGNPGWDSESGVPSAFRSGLFGVPIVVTNFPLVRGGSGAPQIKAFVQA